MKINKTGIFVRKPDAEFSHNLSANMSGAREVVGIRAIVSNLNISPFINLFKVSIPRTLNGSICIFRNSRFSASGQLFAFGKPSNPHVNGDFNVRNINIPQLYTTIRDVALKFGAKDVNIGIHDINSNNSDFNATIQTTWDKLAK